MCGFFFSVLLRGGGVICDYFHFLPLVLFQQPCWSLHYQYSNFPCRPQTVCSSVFFHFDHLCFSLSAIMPPPPQLSDFLSKVSLSFYSLLLCCIPDSVEKGVDKEGGGKRRGNLSFREGG